MNEDYVLAIMTAILRSGAAPHSVQHCISEAREILDMIQSHDEDDEDWNEEERTRNDLREARIHRRHALDEDQDQARCVDRIHSLS